MSFSQTTRSLNLLEKFERITLPKDVKLDLHDKYQLVFFKYGKDVDLCRKTYMKQKVDPPMPRNYPPVCWTGFMALIMTSRFCISFPFCIPEHFLFSFINKISFAFSQPLKLSKNAGRTQFLINSSI